MQSINLKLAAALAAAGLVAAPAAHAYNEKDDLVLIGDFIAMCDTDKDGMVSKAEVMQRVEKMFDKADTRKAGMIDRKQVEFFLRELMKSDG